MVLNYKKENLTKAKSLRHSMTTEERKLWYLFLRNYPLKFRKQTPIDDFIVDFYCDKAKLVIELDGSQHFSEDGMTYDNLRSKVLEKYSLFVMRFTNIDINQHFSSVCEAIDKMVKERTLQK
ncbi:endonuclease domain-containing protein [Phascolarctobacterium sp.]|uniref:endonuclease domain-containing protein n=1 Tax=Phascolarctobacterium sp. TaxID=2049039 RepID=UPI00386EF7FA